MKIRVLIVEPDKPLLESFCTCLSKQGYEVAAVTNGPDVVRSLSKFAPDVLLLEPDLPDGWGDKLLTMMREERRALCVPVVVVTRLDQQAYRYPIREYHVKPISLTRLVNAIREAAEEPTNEAGVD